MIKGFIIYSEEDVEKNRKFLSMCTEKFAKDHIMLELKVIRDDKWQEIVREAEHEKICFAINRSRNYQISRKLEEMRVRVFNNSRVTKICNNKWNTYNMAKRLEIPVMHTELGSEGKKPAFKDLDYPKVIKSCNGHGGSEVFLVSNDAEKNEAISKIRGEYIVQDYANAKGRDIRAYVISDECVIAMCRTAKQGFKSNFSLGGRAEKCELGEKEKEIVKKICDELKPDYIGIDFICDGNRVVLNEIEDAVGARMVYENTDMNIVEKFTDDIKEKL